MLDKVKRKCWDIQLTISSGLEMNIFYSYTVGEAKIIADELKRRKLLRQGNMRPFVSWLLTHAFLLFEEERKRDPDCQLVRVRIRDKRLVRVKGVV